MNSYSMPLAALDCACSCSAAANSAQCRQFNNRCDGEDMVASTLAAGDACTALVVNSASIDCAIVSLTWRRVGANAAAADDEDAADDEAAGSD